MTRARWRTINRPLTPQERETWNRVDRMDAFMAGKTNSLFDPDPE